MYCIISDKLCPVDVRCPPNQLEHHQVGGIFKVRCNFSGPEPSAGGFSGAVQLWCGVAALVLDISGHQVCLGA